MSKILITNDAMTATVEVYELPDPTAPPDEPGEPLYACRCFHCRWDSFVDANTVHLTRNDAIDDADSHLITDHAPADL
jgi:hypothetical protein